MDIKKEVDLYRDTPIRYLGYANEIGEAFRSIVPNSIVWLSYAVASGYVLADTINNGFKAYQDNVTPKTAKNTLLSMTDTLLWQSFASVVVPGLTINRVCAAVQFVQKRSNNVFLKSKWIPTIIGLASIPFIIRPIDNIVEETMNVTYRRWIGYYPK
ncbi:mitochondrial fission process protein 1 [Bombus flavifrons]|uniref:mitochondrial fission process protein 1 n=1 Tax=Bombus flavifrons TaxID=103934 RepID=UPI0037049D4E